MTRGLHHIVSTTQRHRKPRHSKDSAAAPSDPQAASKQEVKLLTYLPRLLDGYSSLYRDVLRLYVGTSGGTLRQVMPPCTSPTPPLYPYISYISPTSPL